MPWYMVVLWIILVLLLIGIVILIVLRRGPKDDGHNDGGEEEPAEELEEEAVPAVVPTPEETEPAEEPEEEVAPAVVPTPEEAEPAKEPPIPEEPKTPLIVTPAIRTEGKKSYINLSVLNDYFEDGDEVTLAILKQKNLLPARIQRVKVIGNSGLEKRLTVRAHAYSAQAQMKIVSLGGEAHIVL